MSQIAVQGNGKASAKQGREKIHFTPHEFVRDIRRNRVVYLLMLIIFAYFIIFNFLPMLGVVVAFEKYTPMKGIFGSRWVGWKNFENFFSGPYTARLIRNTIVIGLLDLCIDFPASIIFALLLNELTLKRFKKVVQTVSYMPYFISSVVVCGLVVTFTQAGGILSRLFSGLTDGKSVNLLNQGAWFWGIFEGATVWQGLGYGSIIYLSALSGIDQSLYEAAEIDGARRWKQTLHVTIPGIMPTIIVMLIMRSGLIFSVSADKILNLYNPANYEFADVINTYVYRMGLVQNDYGLATAVGLFNSVIGLALMIITNTISRKAADTSFF